MKKQYIGAVLLTAGIGALLAGVRLPGELLVGASIGWSTRGICAAQERVVVTEPKQTKQETKPGFLFAWEKAKQKRSR